MASHRFLRYPAQEGFYMTRTVLHVVTNISHYDNPAHKTGLWLSELTHA